MKTGDLEKKRNAITLAKAHNSKQKGARLDGLKFFPLLEGKRDVTPAVEREGTSRLAVRGRRKKKTITSATIKKGSLAKKAEN